MVLVVAGLSRASHACAHQGLPDRNTITSDSQGDGDQFSTRRILTQEQPPPMPLLYICLMMYGACDSRRSRRRRRSSLVKQFRYSSRCKYWSAGQATRSPVYHSQTFRPRRFQPGNRVRCSVSLLVTFIVQFHRQWPVRWPGNCRDPAQWIDVWISNQPPKK